MKLKYPALAEADCFVDGDNGKYKIYENPAQRVFMEKDSEEGEDFDPSQEEPLGFNPVEHKEDKEKRRKRLDKEEADEESITSAAADRNQMVEALSEVFHDAWMHWSKSVAGEIKDPERVARWQTFWVPYDQLDESTKDLDREWAEEAYKLIEPLVQPEKMAKEMVTRVVERTQASENWDGPADWQEDLALTLLAESVASMLEDEELMKDFPEAERMRDEIIRPQEDIVENLKHVIQSSDFGGQRFLPTGLVQKMHQDVDQAFAGKSSLHELYDEYPQGAHRLILNLLGHGVSLDDDKEGVDWMKEKDITRDDLQKNDYYESDYDSALGFIEAWNQYEEGQS